MDHWGDPWADDSETKTPLKEQLVVKKPLATPAVLPHFEDEAQWGDPADGDGFGDCAFSAPIIQQESHAEEEAGLNEVETSIPTPFGATPREQHAVDTPIPAPQLPTSPLENGQVASPLDEDWNNNGVKAIHEPEELGHGIWSGTPDGEYTERITGGEEAEISDSGTTIQPENFNDTHQETETGISDDDASTRPSTSPSDASQLGIPHESPRTSFEEEGTLVESSGGFHDIAKQEVAPLADVDEEMAAVVTQDADLFSGSEDEDDFGDFEEEEEQDQGQEDEEQYRVTKETSPESARRVSIVSQSNIGKEEPAESSGPPREASQPIISHDVTATSFQPDLSLINQLFPTPPPTKARDDASDDIISSTSTRKAWYRLTRKQTMRELNSGDDENSYVRVSWIGSAVRTEVNKIVSRWTAEDRIAGRAVLGGKSAGAIFFWDQPTYSSEQVVGATPRHARKRSSLSSTINIAPPASSNSALVASQSPKSPVAQFTWSSSPRSPQYSSTSKSDAVVGTSRPSVEELARNAVEKIRMGKASRSGMAPEVALPGNHNAPVARVRANIARPSSMDISRDRPSYPTHKRASQSISTPDTYTNATVPPRPLPIVERVRKPPSISTLEVSKSKERHSSTQKIPMPQIETAPKALEAIASTSTLEMDPWAGLTRLDTHSQAPIATSVAQDIPQDEDDDWGEMIQSPVTPVITSILPQGQKKLAAPQQEPLRRQASSIVRLMTPISPTTSSGPTLANPYGPIIKPPGVSRSPSITTPIFKTRTTTPPAPASTTTPFQPQKDLGNDDLPVSETASPVVTLSSTPAEQPARVATPPVPDSPQLDPWANADFSIFGSPSPAAASQPPPAIPTTHVFTLSPSIAASGPRATADFSIFESSAPSVPAPRKPISISPTPTTTVEHSRVSPGTSHPPLPSTKRKEADEAVIIRQIIQGLPDLKYMLH
jgi:hypothetical protein